MLAQVCFPFFDTRFALQDAAGDAGERPAPHWLYGQPPPGMQTVGNFGRVAKWIPPAPYAKCTAADLIHVSTVDEAETAIVNPGLLSIEAVADQHGHVRLSIWFDCDLKAAEPRLRDVVDQFVRTEVAVRHPMRRDVYSPLAESSADLADLYARESARTAREYQGDYVAAWVKSGRPFLILVNTRREALEDDPTLIDVPLGPAAPQIRLSFLPWVSDDGDLAMPVWYLRAPRGGGIWQQPAEAVEDVTARYEELFLCSVLQEQAAVDEEATANFITGLEIHRARVSGSLRRQTRHGVDLKTALRILSDYDRSMLKPRETVAFERTILDRVNESVAGDIRFRVSEQSFGIRRMNVTINQGNIFNYGQMRDAAITNTNAMIGQSAAAPELKSKLQELQDPLTKAAAALPENEAKALLKDYENFTETVLRENPPKELVKAQGNQILDTVKKIAAYAAPVTTIVGAILKLVAG